MKRNPRPLTARVAASLAGVGLLTLAYVGCAAQPGQNPPPPGPGAQGRGAPPGGRVEAFKNLKVLKDMPPQQVLPVMHEWTASLGVRCDHCHVSGGEGGHPDFAKDGKPEKEAARKMFLMVRDLNAHQSILGGKATCFMCHHGSAEPETQAPARRPGGFGPGGGRPGGPGGPGAPGAPGAGRPAGPGG